MTVFFAQNLSFKDANPDVNNALQIIQDMVLKVVPVAYLLDPHVHFHMQPMMECYNVSGKPEDDYELWNINIPKTKGSRDVAAPNVPTDPMSQPLKIRKVNIGTKENTKFLSVGDYWDEETMEKITDLLHEFQDLFLTNFSKMKGILGDLVEMNIPLKPDSKPVGQRQYRLNIWYKETFKTEINTFLAT